MALAAEDGVAQTLLSPLASQLDLDRLYSAWGELCAQHPVVAGLVLLPFGLAFLLYGYRVYKALVILTFAIVGGLIGMFIGAHFALSGIAALLGMAGGALVLGLLAWPLHRVGWGLLGGTVSAVVFAGFATTAGVTVQAYVLVIGGLAFVLGMVLTVWLFRPLLVIITSLVGATLLVEGAVRLVVLSPSFGEPICAFLKENAYVWLIVLLVLAGAGMLMQWYDTSGRAGGAATAKKPAKGNPEAEEA